MLALLCDVLLYVTKIMSLYPCHVLYCVFMYVCCSFVMLLDPVFFMMRPGLMSRCLQWCIVDMTMIFASMAGELAAIVQSW